MRKLISLALILTVVLIGCDEAREKACRLISCVTGWQSNGVGKCASDGRLDPIPAEVLDQSKVVKRKDLEVAFCSCFKNRSSDYPNVWSSWMKIRSKVRVEDSRLNELYCRYKKMGVDPKSSEDYRAVELDAAAWHSRLEEYEQSMKQVYLDDSRFRLTDVSYEGIGDAAKERKRQLLNTAAEISRMFPMQ